MPPTFVHWTAPDGATHLAGRLATVGPAGLQRFTYDSSWLAGPGFPLGEGLPAVSGPMLAPGGATEFGLFLDAGPDAWGRRLLFRKGPGPLRSGTDFLLVKRFDRTPGGRRGYQSMRTAARLGPNDAIDYRIAAMTAGYHCGAEGVEAIVALAVLNITVNNIDDHSRNAGFLQDSSGLWSPAPVFDIVPYPGPSEGTPLHPGGAGRSLSAILDIDWSIPARTVEDVAQRVTAAASRVYQVAAEQYGLDPEAAETAERHRASAGLG